MGDSHLLESINQNIREALFRSSEEGLIYANRAYAKMFGFKDEEEAIHTPSVLIYKDPEDRRKLVKKLIKDGFSENQEITFVRKDGSEFIGLVSTTLFEDDDGRIFWDGSIRDITKQREVINKLLDRKQLLNSINKNINEAIYRSVNRGNLIYANDEFVRMFGYENAEEVLDLEVYDLYRNPDDRNKLGDEIVEKGSIFNREIEFKRKDGTTFWGYLNSIKVKGLDGKIYFDGAIRNITKEKEAEQELRKLFDKTIEQNQRLKDFSYITSHNFRSSVANLMGLITIIEEDRNNDEFFKMLKDTSLKLNLAIDSINDLLNFEKDIAALEKDDCNLLDIVSDVIILNKKTANEKNITFHIDISKELTVRALPAYLQSIVSNLITNAMKYGITDDKRNIYINVEKQEEVVLLVVADDGVGIDMERYGEKLFQLGSRFHAGMDSGHGMGLYITKQQIEAIGGRVEVESEVNKGTKFKIYLNA